MVAIVSARASTNRVDLAGYIIALHTLIVFKLIDCCQTLSDVVRPSSLVTSGRGGGGTREAVQIDYI